MEGKKREREGIREIEGKRVKDNHRNAEIREWEQRDMVAGERKRENKVYIEHRRQRRAVADSCNSISWYGGGCN